MMGVYMATTVHFNIFYITDFFLCKL